MPTGAFTQPLTRGLSLSLTRAGVPSAFAELNLLAPTLDPRITFTGGPISYVGSDGLLHTSAANEWPLEYDPVSLLPVGRSAWEARTNLCTWSSDTTQWGLNAGGGVGSTPLAAANYGVAPNGATVAGRLRLALNGGNTSADRSQATLPGIVKVAGTAYTQSVYLKSNTGTSYKVILRNGGTSTLATVTASWTRFTTIETNNGDQTSTVELRGGLSTSDSADLLVWAGQVEASSAAGPVILTAGAQVTRAAQVATVNDLTTLRFNAAAGTLYAEMLTPTDTGILRGLVGFDDGSSANRIMLRRDINNDALAQLVSSAGSSGSTVSGALAGASLLRKYALAYDAAGSKAAVGRTLGSSGVALTMPVVNRLRIGTAMASSYWNAPIKRVRYYPRKLSDAELQALTT